MHRDRGVEVQRECLWEHPLQISVSPCQGNLADTNTRAATNQCELCEIAVSAYREDVAGEALD